MFIIQRAESPTPIRLADTIIEDIYEPIAFEGIGVIPATLQVTAQRLESGRWLATLWGSDEPGAIPEPLGFAPEFSD